MDTKFLHFKDGAEAPTVTHYCSQQQKADDYVPVFGDAPVSVNARTIVGPVVQVQLWKLGDERAVLYPFGHAPNQNLFHLEEVVVTSGGNSFVGTALMEQGRWAIQLPDLDRVSTPAFVQAVFVP